MKKQTLDVKRIEMKHLISISGKLYLIENLKKILNEDTYGENGYYNVRSLYFDNENDQDYIDKLENAEIRKGIRLRIYTPMDKTAKLEIKRKNGDNQQKSSLKIKRNDAIEIINGNYEVLKKYSTPVANELYKIMIKENYRPVTVVNYHRKAFDSRTLGVRITIDSNITYNNYEFNIFDEKLPLYNLSSIGENVLEIKLENDMPKSLDKILNEVPKIGKPSSKYKRSRLLLTAI
ncbi:polyphosphate polymerase domain-containing protein [Fusobacterium sp.]|uniref:polyphosphate polymerase domain-containing protein n=1 Tax=Fusobacterium sp. TaxID=68766 RepID=UPI0026169991|nr:polyphosphate polymerase domain-containing protein [Fusobacterium sp.]